MKSFTDKHLLRDFITNRPALQELLKEALNKERNNQYQPLQKKETDDKDHLHNEQIASVNGQNKQLASKWQDQIYT